MKLAGVLLLLAQVAGEVTISGKVTDAVTHQPISEVQITYCCAHYATATSDINGTWSLQVTPDDSGGNLTVAKAGYAFGGASLPARPGVSQTHDFELTPAAKITGRIVDRDSGKPLPGFVVTAQTRNGTQIMVSRPAAADGSFNIAAAAPPGDYVLEIDPPVAGTITSGPSEPDLAGYGRTWYPGATRVEMAAPVTLVAGESRDIEVRLQKRSLCHLAGVFESPQGDENEGIAISVTAAIAPVRTIANGAIPRAGAFRIDGLSQGSYVLYAQMKKRDGKPAFAIRNFEIVEHSIDDLKVTMHSGVSVRAKVSMAERDTAVPEGLEFAPEAFTKTHFSDTEAKLEAHLFGNPLFLSGYPAGEYWPRMAVPAGYAIASVSFNGRPVVNTTVDLEAPESTIAFVLTSRPAGVAGMVRDANSNPSPDARVVLLPEPLPETPEKFDPRALRLSISDRAGVFRFMDLPPGRYKAVALTGADRERYQDLGYLVGRLPGVETVVVDFGQTATVELRVK